MIFGQVYCHIHKFNRKTYVGIAQNPEQRWGLDGRGYKGQDFYQFIQASGWDSFEHHILTEELPYEICEQIERRIISQLNLTDRANGYNSAIGPIEANSDCDTLAAVCIDNIKNKQFPVSHITAISYQTNTNNYSIKSIVEDLEKGRIQVGLIYQRHYQWNENQVQGMWDTLLHSERIPECHIIAYNDGKPKQIIDGQQRLRTIQRIVTMIVVFLKNFIKIRQILLIPYFQMVVIKNISKTSP